jgi:AcrR family transcriptional regulator
MASTKPRPETDARQRLLDSGERLAAQQGLKAMTVRAVAAAAQANLGSFVYHFGTRDAFIEALVERWYGPMFQRMQFNAAEASAADGDTLAALRQALLQLVGWLVEHRAFLAHLVQDAAGGEAAAQRFLRGLDQRHPALLLRLVANAQQAGQLQRGDPLHQLMFLMSTLAVPVLAFQLLRRHPIAPPELLKPLTALSTDMAAVEQRLAWALRGLAPQQAVAA